MYKLLKFALYSISHSKGATARAASFVLPGAGKAKF
jgi:hypothetical protein